MIHPVQSGNDFLSDVKRASEAAEPFHLWWLGQSGFLLQWNGRHVLFDPYLSDSLTVKYAGTAKPHVRMTERVIEPARLDFIDIVTSTHNHTDHLDAATLGPLMDSNPDMKLVIPEANRAFVAARLSIQPKLPIGLDDGVSVTIGDFVVSGVPAAHEELDLDSEGRNRYLGYVVKLGQWTVYHSGDTIRFDGMAETLLKWDIDVAILPINGADPNRAVAGNLSALEAAQLAHDIGARIVIPCHYEMFEFNTASPAPFVETCRRLGQHYVVLRAGERWSCDLRPADNTPRREG